MKDFEIIEMAVMREETWISNAKQTGSKFFIGRFFEVYCSFTKTTSTFCVRISEFFPSGAEAEEARNSSLGLLGYAVVEKGPIVEGSEIEYYPSKNCMAPIRQWAMEKALNLRLK